MRATSAAPTPWPAIVKKPMSVQAALTALATAVRPPAVPSVKGAMSMKGTVTGPARPAE